MTYSLENAKVDEAIMMQAGMTRADIRRSVRMAQLPKELHETILAEVMRRKRVAQNVAIKAVWRAFLRLGASGRDCVACTPIRLKVTRRHRCRRVSYRQ